MNIDVNINPAYYNYLDADQRVQVFFGGASAGKSTFIADRVIYDFISGDRNFLCIRKTKDTLRFSVFNELKKAVRRFGIEALIKINKTDMSFTNIARQNQIVLKGLDDVEKLKSITPERGVLTDIWIEEATEIRQDDYLQLSKRLRGISDYKKRITLTFNPILRTHWIYKKWFTGNFKDGDKVYRGDDLLILKTIYKDNKFLEQDDIEDLENETDQYTYDVYTLGNWGVLGDLIFTNWEVKDLSEVKKTADKLFNGIDFGYAQDPFAFNRNYYNRKKKELYILQELHGYGWSNEMIAERTKPIIGREVVVCDSAEPKSIAELKRYNLTAQPAAKGKDSVLFGIRWLQAQKIFIDKSCVHTINEFQMYQWAKNKQGEVLPRPVDSNNHHIDDIRYGMESESMRSNASYKVTLFKW